MTGIMHFLHNTVNGSEKRYLATADV